jgi:hypothetical protein
VGGAPDLGFCRSGRSTVFPVSTIGGIDLGLSWSGATTPGEFCGGAPKGPNGCDRLDGSPSVRSMSQGTPKPAQRIKTDPANQATARWAHLWMCAAAHTLEQLEATWDDSSPASSIGARDSLSLVLTDASSNVLRGAEKVFGRDHAVIKRFTDKEGPLAELRDLRNRLEHFDDYLNGTGKAQNKSQDLSSGDVVGMCLHMSASGIGNNGHTVQIKVLEKEPEDSTKLVPKLYELKTRRVVEAVIALARATLDHVELLDAKHLAACRFCSDAEKTRKGVEGAP